MEWLESRGGISWSMQLRTYNAIYWRAIMGCCWLAWNKSVIIVYSIYSYVDDQEFNNYVEIVKKLSKLDDDNLTYRILPTIDKLLNHRTSAQ